MDIGTLGSLVAIALSAILVNIWQGYETSRSTDKKLNEIHTLVNNQLSEAVGRFNEALMHIEELKRLLNASHEREMSLEAKNENR